MNKKCKPYFLPLYLRIENQFLCSGKADGKPARAIAVQLPETINRLCKFFLQKKERGGGRFCPV